MTIAQQIETLLDILEGKRHFKYYVSVYVPDFGEDGNPFLAKMQDTKLVMNQDGEIKSQATGTDILIMSPDTARLLAESVGGDIGRELIRLADAAVERGR